MSAIYSQVLFVLRPPVENYPPTLHQVAILIEQGFRVTILCAPSGALMAASGAVPKGVRRISIETEGAKGGLVARALGVARFQRAVRHWVAAVQPDIVMACDAEAAWAVGTGRRPGQRLVWHFHELPERQNQGLSVNLANRWVWRHARCPDLIVFPDPGRASVFAADAGLPVEPIQIVANCPRPVRELPSPTLRETLGALLPAGAQVVLYHGPIGPDHDLETGIRSMRLWPADGCFVMKGKGAPDYIATLRALAATEGVGERVLIYSPGFQSYEDHCRFIAGADLGWTVLAPVSRNWEFSAFASNKRFECMALGVPQVTNLGPMLADLVELGDCGVCVPLDDASAVGMAIATLLADPERRVRMGASGRRLHLERFHYDHQFTPVLRWLSSGGQSG